VDRQSLDIDYMELLYEDDTVSIVECLLLHEGINRNKCNISHDIVLDSLSSLANKPIYGIFNSKFLRSVSTDFLEHGRTTEEREDIVIFGVFPESAVKNAEFIEKNDKIYLKVQAMIWKIYSPIAIKILKNRKGNVKISIEITVSGIQNKDTGILDVEKMKFLSAVVLGEGIKEGIEGSNINVVRFSLDETIERSNNLIFEEKYKIPTKVKENASEGIKLRKEVGRGGTTFALSNAKYLIKNDYITLDKIKDIVNYFSKNDDKIYQNLWGGKEGLEWGENIIKDKTINNENINFISKDLVGSKPTIKINKSKEALSDSSWSDEGIRKECLLASNYKTLCTAVFQRLEEGWEEGKEGSLGYPVMEKSGDEVHYNRKGLASARAYAVKNNETEITSKLKAIYKKLDLPWDDEDKKGEGDSKMSENINTANTEEVITNTDANVISNTDATIANTEADVSNVVKTEVNTEEVVVNTEVTDEVLKNKLKDVENKLEETTNKCHALEEKLATYKKAEEEQKMCNTLEEYSHCFSQEEKEEILANISKNSLSEFEEKINNKVKEFALKMKEDKSTTDIKVEDKKEETRLFSVSPFGPIENIDLSKTFGENGLDSIIKNSGVKIK